MLAKETTTPREVLTSIWRVVSLNLVTPVVHPRADPTPHPLHPFPGTPSPHPRPPRLPPLPLPTASGPAEPTPRAVIADLYSTFGVHLLARRPAPPSPPPTRAPLTDPLPPHFAATTSFSAASLSSPELRTVMLEAAGTGRTVPAVLARYEAAGLQQRIAADIDARLCREDLANQGHISDAVLRRALLSLPPSMGLADVSQTGASSSTTLRPFVERAITALPIVAPDRRVVGTLPNTLAEHVVRTVLRTGSPHPWTPRSRPRSASGGPPAPSFAFQGVDSLGRAHAAMHRATAVGPVSPAPAHSPLDGADHSLALSDSIASLPSVIASIDDDRGSITTGRSERDDLEALVRAGRWTRRFLLGVTLGSTKAEAVLRRFRRSFLRAAFLRWRVVVDDLQRRAMARQYLARKGAKRVLALLLRGDRARLRRRFRRWKHRAGFRPLRHQLGDAAVPRADGRFVVVTANSEDERESEGEEGEED